MVTRKTPSSGALSCLGGESSLDPTGNSICGGSLISPTHVLSASHCSVYDIRWVSIGSHYRNGTQDGEQIRVVSLMNHPSYSMEVKESHDFMVLELERPSKFTPVKLAAADNSDFKAGKWATTMGWGTDAERVDIQLMSDEECATNAAIDSTMVCAGGVQNKDSCFGDSGGPLIVQGAGEGSTDDLLIGVVSWSKDDTCGREGYPGIYSRVSSVRAWIDSITGGNGTCLG
ncbi:serine protease trypsin-like protein [Phytophthora sojae]|uniref:Serine protease trypsin-like protein n=1 Tax=Phytophthora sojae (strain P6497) TaxID=1094619 RepID=G5AE56_PHYSP|nr:serine protease trypsin-like protein [Phytophthora sojae]EGZ06458.1 serine protease trypsin-like protein [Phytophthora sojae]|eukprot:XP_009538355.1 serine protease trypsin-like protein [Phytophthora sojae]